MNLLSRIKAAEYIGVSPHTLANWASNGSIGPKFIKMGSVVKYRQCDLDDFMEAHVVSPQGDANE